MSVISCGRGRLGNSIFRYLACCVIMHKYGRQYTVDNSTPSTYLDDMQFKYILNNECKLNSDRVLMAGFYQFDYFAYRDIIKATMTAHPEHPLPIDQVGYNYTVGELINTPSGFDKVHHTVMHVRLEDFVTLTNEYIKIDKVIALLASLDLSGGLCIVCTPITTDFEREYITTLTRYLNDRDVVCVVESNDIVTDFHIMANATRLICSLSTISWCAAFLSDTLLQCYMPDYRIIRDHQTFKTPINNTILYNIY